MFSPNMVYVAPLNSDKRSGKFVPEKRARKNHQ